MSCGSSKPRSTVLLSVTPTFFTLIVLPSKEHNKVVTEQSTFSLFLKVTGINKSPFGNTTNCDEPAEYIAELRGSFHSNFFLSDQLPTESRVI